MSILLTLAPQDEISADIPVNLEQTRQPQYGRYLDELEPGQVFEHPRGFTFATTNMLDFARNDMLKKDNPIYIIYRDLESSSDVQAMIAIVKQN